MLLSHRGTPYAVLSQHVRASILLVCAFVLLTEWAHAQTQRPARTSADGMWIILDAETPSALTEGTTPLAKAGKAIALNRIVLDRMMKDVPAEDAKPVRQSTSVITLPGPDGTFQRFAFVESPILAPGIAAQVPQIRTFLGQGIDDPAATVRFDITPLGFHAQVLTPEGNGSGGRQCFCIDPVAAGDVTTHVSYARQDAASADPWQCSTPNADAPMAQNTPQQGLQDTTVTRKVLRLAVAATGEFTTTASKPDPPNVLLSFSAIATAVNRVNQVFENDLAVRLVIVSGLSEIYTNPSTDPYSGSQSDMQAQNQANLDNVIGSANYEMGHLFHYQSSGYGGNAGGIGTTCAFNKASAISACSTLSGDYFAIDLVAHEMGHQLGATHTFNGTNGSCGSGGQYTSFSAYEPGGGTTIMSYNGTCGTDDVPTHTGTTGAKFPMFNFSSISQITNRLAAGGCATSESTANRPPFATMDTPWVVPTNTPFKLRAIGADYDDGSNLSFSWEQADLGPQLALGPDTGKGEPLFRVLMHGGSDERVFPQWSDILLGTTTRGEYLPQYARANSKFKFVVRDNVAGAGGTGIGEVSVQFVQVSGGFKVTSPDTDTRWCAGGTGQVIWNVAGTTAAPISCSRVDIRMSIDGGQTFPYLLFNNDVNIGFATVSIPPFAQDSNKARVMVQARDNIFFSVNPHDFQICSGPPTIDTQPTDVYVCPRTWPPVLSFTTGGGSVQTYTWYKNGQLYGTTFLPYVTFDRGANDDSGDYYCVVGNVCGSATTNTVRVQIGVTFDQQPASDSVPACTLKTFSVIARGVGPLSYQWRKDGVNLSNGGRLSGVTGPTLSIGSTRFDDEGLYDCVVTDSCESRTTYPAARLTISTPPVWVKRNPPTSPSTRSGYAMVYDSLRKRTVLVGGVQDYYSPYTTTLMDTWEWNGHTWTQAAVGGITPRHSHVATYDPVRGRVVVFGGVAQENYPTSGIMSHSKETWEWDGATWVRTATTGPAARRYQGMAYDPASNRVLLCAGTDYSSAYYTDTWAYDGIARAWTQVANTIPNVQYSRGDGTVMGYDPIRSRVLLCTYDAFNMAYTRFYEWDGSQWAEIYTASSGVSLFHTPLSMDTHRGRWVRATGYRQGYGLNLTTWFYRGPASDLAATFEPWLPDGPAPARVYAWMAYDLDRKAHVLFGGHGTGSSLSDAMADTWELVTADIVRILEQPVGQPLNVGTPVTFKVLAVGAGTLSYQWRRNGTALVDGPAAGGSALSGTTTSALTINPVGAADVGSYDCVVGNACSAITCQQAVLTACPGPAPDLDRDCDVDDDDFIVFANCVSGPAVPHNGNQICRAADFDHDGDIDQADFGIFQRCYNGPNSPADPNCVN